MLLMVLVAVYALIVLLALISDRLIFQPHATFYDLASLARSEPGAVVPVKVPCEGGRLAAVYLPNPQAHFTLLFSHGNGEDIGDDLPVLELFRHAGFAVFAYDYNGYGQSEGRPSEQAVYRNVEAAYDFLTATLHVPHERVIAFGHSLGAAAAIHLAVNRPVSGLIAQAPFLSAFRVLTRVSIVPWDKFNNARTIGQVHCPVLIAHGRRDQIVPFRQGERIYQLANAPKSQLWLDQCGHNDVMLVASDCFLQALRDFAEAIQQSAEALRQRTAS